LKGTLVTLCGVENGSREGYKRVGLGWCIWVGQT